VKISPLAGKPAPKTMLVDPIRLEREYYERRPDLADAAQLVRFGTSGHRGSPLHGAPSPPPDVSRPGRAASGGLVPSGAEREAVEQDADLRHGEPGLLREPDHRQRPEGTAVIATLAAHAAGGREQARTVAVAKR
jgi:hypothetical protein